MNPGNQFYVNQLYENHPQFFSISSISENNISINENIRAYFLYMEKSNFHEPKLHRLCLLRAFVLVKYI